MDAMCVVRINVEAVRANIENSMGWAATIPEAEELLRTLGFVKFGCDWLSDELNIQALNDDEIIEYRLVEQPTRRADANADPAMAR